MEDIVLLLFFVCIYLGMVLVGKCLDKMLRKIFGRGIFPDGYFK